MPNILRMPAALKEIGDTFGFADDFEWFVTAHRWTSLAADAGASVAITAAAVGGILALTTGGTNNNEALAYSASIFKPAANKPLYCEALLQWTEANTDDANVAFGWASSPGADLLVDDGAGMRTTGTVIAIYKVDGETLWRFVTRNGSGAMLGGTMGPGMVGQAQGQDMLAASLAGGYMGWRAGGPWGAVAGAIAAPAAIAPPDYSTERPSDYWSRMRRPIAEGGGGMNWLETMLATGGRAVGHTLGLSESRSGAPPVPTPPSRAATSHRSCPASRCWRNRDADSGGHDSGDRRRGLRRGGTAQAHR